MTLAELNFPRRSTQFHPAWPFFLLAALWRFVGAAALSFMALCSGNARADEPPCVFNAHAFSAATYRHRPGVAFVQWNESRATAAIVTRSGRAVGVRHWRCQHLGAEARVVIDDGASSPEIAAALAELADAVLPVKVAQRVPPSIAATRSIRGMRIGSTCRRVATRSPMSPANPLARRSC